MVTKARQCDSNIFSRRATIHLHRRTSKFCQKFQTLGTRKVKKSKKKRNIGNQPRCEQARAATRFRVKILAVAEKSEFGRLVSCRSAEAELKRGKNRLKFNSRLRAAQPFVPVEISFRNDASFRRGSSVKCNDLTIGARVTQSPLRVGFLEAWRGRSIPRETQPRFLLPGQRRVEY